MVNHRCVAQYPRAPALSNPRTPLFRFPRRWVHERLRPSMRQTVATNPLIEIRNGRLRKADSVRSLGLNPYPSTSKRTHYAKAILDDFDKMEGQTVTVAGRLLSWRKQGALAFGHVQDQTGRIQLFLRRNLVQPTNIETSTLGYSETNLLDLGDIVEATGKVIKPERGEISVLVENVRLLTKA